MLQTYLLTLTKKRDALGIHIEFLWVVHQLLFQGRPQLVCNCTIGKVLVPPLSQCSLPIIAAGYRQKAIPIQL